MRRLICVFVVHIWAASWQNQQNECAPSDDSDQPGHPSFLNADSEDSDQTGRMPRLIWVIAGPHVTLVICCKFLPLNDFLAVLTVTCSCWPKYIIFSPVKIPFFSNCRALWIKLNKFTIKNLTCNDITTVCICYVLLILLLYFLSCPYSAWTNANCLTSLFLHLPKIMDKKKEHCYHSYFCFL